MVNKALNSRQSRYNLHHTANSDSDHHLHFPQSISVGDKIPDTPLMYVPYSPELADGSACGTPQKTTTHKEFAGKKVAVIAVPGERILPSLSFYLSFRLTLPSSLSILQVLSLQHVT